MTEPTQIDSTDSPRLRSDAALNRRRILNAAAELFAERGLDVPMSAIARRAGVGVATVFRRFPDRAGLVGEAFDTQLDHCEEVLAEAVADPDPWRGFRRFLETICRMQVDDRGLTEALLSIRAAQEDLRTRAGGDRFSERRRRTEVELALLVERAKRSGMLRADFTVSDLTMVMVANSGIGTASGDHAHELSRRLVAFLLIAFGTEAARAQITLPPPARMDISELFVSAK